MTNILVFQVSCQFYQIIKRIFAPFISALGHLGLCYVPQAGAVNLSAGHQIRSICPSSENWLTLRHISVKTFAYHFQDSPLHTHLALNGIVEVHHPSIDGCYLHHDHFDDVPEAWRSNFFVSDFIHACTIDPVQDLSLILSDSWSRNQ